MKAVWNGQLIAESDRTELVEGNYYFPPESVHREFLRDTDAHSTCPWKGVSFYYNLVVDGKVNERAAWCYPEPKSKASYIKNYVAFWKGVEISK